MKQFSRLAMVFALALVMVLGPLSVSAQDDGTILCNGLSTEDCQVLNDALASMQGVSSFAMPSFNAAFSFSDGTNTMSFSAAGSGEMVMPTDEAGTGMAMHLMLTDFSLADSSDGTDQSGALELLVLDGMTYVQRDGTWYGETMEEGNASEIASMVMQLTQIQSAVGQLSAGSGMDLSTVVTTTADGGTFTSVVDVAGLLSAFLMSPTGMEMLSSEMGGADMSQMTPEDMAMMAQMFAPMFTGTSIQMATSVSEDGMVSGTQLDLVVAIDLSAVVPGMTPINAELHFGAEMAQYGETFTFEAPAEYSPMADLDLNVPDPSSLLGGLTGAAPAAQ
jgi:hypothetical protein